MYNLDKSIEDFARSCFNYGLIKMARLPINKKYDLKNMMGDLKIFFRKFLRKSSKMNLKKIVLLTNIG